MAIDFSKYYNKESSPKGKIDFSKYTSTTTGIPSGVEQKDLDWLEQRASAGKSLASNPSVLTPAPMAEGALSILDLGRNMIAGIANYSLKSNNASEKQVAKTLQLAIVDSIKNKKGLGDVLMEKYGNPNSVTYGDSGIWGSALLKELANYADPMMIPYSKIGRVIKQAAVLGKDIAQYGVRSAFKDGVKISGKSLPEGAKVTADVVEGVTKPTVSVSEFHPTQSAINTEFDTASKVIDYNAMPKPDADKALFDRITENFSNIKNLTKEQQKLISSQRRQRIASALEGTKNLSGQAKAEAERKLLSGTMEKVEFESVAKNFSQNEVDRMFNLINDNKDLSVYEKISAKNGLSRIMNADGGNLPRPSELELLDKVFPSKVVDSLLDSKPFWAKAKDLGIEVANVPRAIMSSLDVSAPFRQGIGLIRRKEFWQSMAPMIKSLGSEKAFQELNQSIINHPNFGLMQESALSLSNMGRRAGVAAREERFASGLAERVPVFGRAVRASGRAYTGFLNKLRADTFNSLVKDATVLGRNPHEDIELASNMAKYINAATGRGTLGKLETSANVLNATLFSPRLIASRVQLLNPAYYVKLDPMVRKEALKNMGALVGAVATVGGIAKQAGAEVSVDPRSSDFGKIKIGNTRIDTMGGFQQYVRLAAQLATGKTVNTTTGKVRTMGEGYKATTPLDILQRNLEYKLAPIASYAVGAARGKTAFGEDFKWDIEAAKRFQPMITSDIKELYDDNPNTLPLAFLSLMGFGLQTYKEKTPYERNIEKSRKTLDSFTPEAMEKKRNDIYNKLGSK